jgi:hypothetical protein
LIRPSHQERVGPRPQLHGVVRDQPVSADDQIQRALALADAALADDQHAEPEDVHQHAMDDGTWGQVDVERVGQPVHQQRRRGAGFHDGKPGAIGFSQHFGRGMKTGGDDEARDGVRKHLADDRDTLLVAERLEEPDLALAEDEHTSFAQVLVEPGEGQSGLLGMRIGDAPVDAGRAGQQLEVHPRRFGEIADQRGHRDAGRESHLSSVF